MLKLSIITINLNKREGLKKTMQSVFEQSFKDFEYIVIDGGSTDGSKELLQSYSSKITYWVSEKDNGIYHAMNKGAAKSTGNYLLFLNAADVLTDKKVIEKVADEIIKTNERYSFYTGNMQLIKNGFIAVLNFMIVFFQWIVIILVDAAIPLAIAIIIFLIIMRIKNRRKSKEGGIKK